MSAEIEHGDPVSTKLPSIEVLFRTAWKKTPGAKASFLGGIILFFLASGVLKILEGLIVGEKGGVLGTPFFILNMALGSCLLAGLLDMSIERASKRSISPTMVFKHFDKWFPLTLAWLVQLVFISVGFFLLIIPGVYLSIAYMFSLPVIVREGTGFWEGMERSRRVVTANWFSVFCSIFLLTVIIVLSAIPLGIGLIWSIPWSYIVLGEIYLHLFGTEK